MEQTLDYCIAFISAIMGVSYPLLLQCIERIDDKYQSSLIVEYFRSSTSFILLQVLLPLSIIISAINICVAMGETMDDAIDQLLIISVLFLMMVWFKVVVNIMIFYIPQRLLNRILSKLRKKYSRDAFNVAGDIYIAGLSKFDENLAQSFYSYLVELILEYDEKSKENKLMLPNEILYFIRSANEAIVNNKDQRTLSYYNENFATLLIDDQFNTRLSEEAYKILWVVLCTQIKAGKVQLFMRYWTFASQHVMLQNNRIDIDENMNDEVNKENLNYWKWFHIRIGAVIYYKKQQQLLHKILWFSNQQPPKYYLIPSTINDVVDYFMQTINNKHYIPNSPVQIFSYMFPDMDGAVELDSTIDYIQEYLVILFLRLYIIPQYFVYESSIDNPSLPGTVKELSEWISGLTQMKNIAENKGQELVEIASLPMSSLSWYRENGRPTPTECLNKIIDNCQQKIREIEVNQHIDQDRENEFKQYWLNNINDYLAKYKFLSNTPAISWKKWAQKFNDITILEKNAFIEDVAIAYNGFEYIAGVEIIDKIGIWIQQIIYNQCRRFSLPEQDLTKIFNKFRENIVIIGVNQNFNYYQQYGIDVQNCYDITSNFLPQGFFLMEKKNIPSLTPLEINDTPSLNEIDENVKIQGEVELELSINEKARFIYIQNYNIFMSNAKPNTIDEINWDDPK